MRLVFWNCGVAPTRGKGKRTAADAAAVVDAALRDGVDLVSLCEVNEEAVGEIRKAVTVKRTQAIAITHAEGKSRWDLAVFYRSERLRCRRGGPVLCRNGDVARAAHSIRVHHLASEAELVLYVLHWRSRVSPGNPRDHRNRAAKALRADIDRRLEQGLPVVVLGDFNDEPFDAPVSEHLRASRDPTHVAAHPSRLYNPTWWLASPRPDDPWAAFGSTSPYRTGTTSSRYLLDQALTSAHFLDAETRRAPRVRVYPDATSLLGAPGATMDHLPLELTLP